MMAASSSRVDWNAAAANAVVATLRANGVMHVVISPGSRSTPLVVAAAERLNTTVVLDERVAGFHALGLARQHGNCALICTSGTAGAHYYPAVIEAALSRTPLVVMTADRPPELQDCGAPQTIRQGDLFGCHVRYSATLPTPSNISHVHSASKLASRALAEALGSPRGPVHLNVPFRKPLWQPGVAQSVLPVIPSVTAAVTGTGGLETVEAELRDANRPAIFIGPHAPKGALAAATKLGRNLSIPVLTEMASPEQTIAHLELLLRSGVLCSRLQPDLLIHVGNGPIGRAVIDWLDAFDGAYIALDPDGWHHSTSRAADHVWAGDVTAALERLTECRSAINPDWNARWIHLSAVASSALEGLSDAMDERTVATLVSSLRSNIHVASSMPIRDVAAFGRPTSPTYSRGTNGIDGTIATATGLGSKTVLLGDLALRHDVGGLILANELNSDLDVVCIDNSGGGIFHLLPIAENTELFERYFVTPQAADLCRLAAASGADVVVAESPDALRQFLLSPPNGVRVVIAKVDRTESVRNRNTAIQCVTQAVDREVLR